MCCCSSAAAKFCSRSAADLGIWGGLWSLPEIPLDDDARAFARRRFDADATVGADLPPIEHGFTHFALTLHPQRIRVTNWPRARGSAAICMAHARRCAARGAAGADPQVAALVVVGVSPRRPFAQVGRQPRIGVGERGTKRRQFPCGVLTSAFGPQAANARNEFVGAACLRFILMADFASAGAAARSTAPAAAPCAASRRSTRRSSERPVLEAVMQAFARTRARAAVPRVPTTCADAREVKRLRRWRTIRGDPSGAAAGLLAFRRTGMPTNVGAASPPSPSVRWVAVGWMARVRARAPAPRPLAARVARRHVAHDRRCGFASRRHELQHADRDGADRCRRRERRPPLPRPCRLGASRFARCAGDGTMRGSEDRRIEPAGGDALGSARSSRSSAGSEGSRSMVNRAPRAIPCAALRSRSGAGS